MFMKLYEIQVAMKEAFLLHEEASQKKLQEIGISKERFNIYKNNIRMTQKNALELLYPCVLSVVGDICFSELVMTYLDVTPGQQEAVYEIGRAFSHFLKDKEHLFKLPYLWELASLEWTRYEIYHGKGGEPLSEATLKECLLSFKEASSYFMMNPASKLMTFEYPIFDIFQCCYGKQEAVYLEKKQNYLLVIQRQGKVYCEPLSPGEFVFLSFLQEGYPWQIICEKTWQVDPQAEVSWYLQDHLFRGTMVGVHF